MEISSSVILNFAVIFHISVLSKTEKNGPYLTTLTEIKKCENVHRLPYEDDAHKTANFDIYLKEKRGRPLIMGNITILRNTGKLKGRIRCYSISNGVRKLRMKIDNMSCRSHVVSALMHFVRLYGFRARLNRATCNLDKGSFEISGVDIDLIDHAMPSLHSYGIIMWEMMAFTDKNTIGCLEFYTNNTAIPEHV